MFLVSWLSGWNPIILAATLAHLGHLVTDQFTNNPPTLTYFLLYRLAKRFRARELMRIRNESDLYREFLQFPGVLSVLHRLHPRFRKYRIED